jgi:endonuclease/exonuclease/phosphatase family metal-dependent hydrolase
LNSTAIHSEKLPPTELDHELGSFFPQLAQFSSTPSLKASKLYKELRPQIEKVLGTVVHEELAHAAATTPKVSVENYSREIRPVRVTAWNIERGIRLKSIIDVLREHPAIIDSDVLLLTELDYGMARSGNLFVAREIALALGLNYAFAPCYMALNKGSGLESQAAGENQQALHGNALFSRYPLAQAHSIALPNGKDKMRGKEKRLGCQSAVVADVEHPMGTFRAVSLHLDAHSTQRHRHRQMKLVLDHLETLQPSLPVIIGGDWNTSTYNSRRPVYAILGFARRVMMGVSHFIRTHYLHPDRWFERTLFKELEKRGYSYHDLNEDGVGTLHYDVENIAVNANMADWVPRWCFWWLRWSLKDHNGRASLKLDWFAGKEITPAPSREPRVIGNLRDADGPLSDHDAIVVEFIPAS